jgi:AraC family transcriptional regulator
MRTALQVGGTGATRTAHIRAVVQAIDLMRTGLARPHPLAELARAAMFSPYHFHTVFRTLTGLPPARFLALLRMVEARRLLGRSRLPVAHVGARVGYRSASTFTFQFGRTVGVSPARFRLLARALADERAGDRTARPRTRPDGAAAVLRLAEPPRPGSLVYACLVGEGSAGAGRGQWTVATRRGPVPLPVPAAAGEYEAFLLAVPAGVRLADALVDDRPGSYLLGRTTVSLPGPQAGVTVRATLRDPAACDPPIVALTLPQWQPGTPY